MPNKASKLPRTQADRSLVLERNRSLKMARSAHAYVREIRPSSTIGLAAPL